MYSPSFRGIGTIGLGWASSLPAPEPSRNVVGPYEPQDLHRGDEGQLDNRGLWGFWAECRHRIPSPLQRPEDEGENAVNPASREPATAAGRLFPAAVVRGPPLGAAGVGDRQRAAGDGGRSPLRRHPGLRTVGGVGLHRYASFRAAQKS